MKGETEYTRRLRAGPRWRGEVCPLRGWHGPLTWTIEGRPGHTERFQVCADCGKREGSDHD